MGKESLEAIINASKSPLCVAGVGMAVGYIASLVLDSINLQEDVQNISENAKNLMFTGGLIGFGIGALNKLMYGIYNYYRRISND